MRECEKWLERELTEKERTYCVGGWIGAFENMQQWLMGRRCTGEDVLDYVTKELSGG